MNTNANLTTYGSSRPATANNSVMLSAALTSPKARTEDEYIKTVPNKARAMPTEHRIKYFHPASSEALRLKKLIRNVVARVVASIATQRMPRLLARVARIMANIKR